MAATLALVTNQKTNSILKYNVNDGSYAGVFASSLLTNPQGLAVGPDGKVYVSNNNNDIMNPLLAVLRYNSDGSSVTEFASDTNLQSLAGLCFDANGKLYVANPLGNNVFRFNADGSNGVVFASGNDLTGPRSCRIGADGKLYVTSLDLTRGILRFHSDGSFDPNFFIPVGDAPQDLIQDSNGNWYVSDSATKSVMKYNSSWSLQGLFATAGGGNPAGGGLAFLPDGSLLVARWDTDLAQSVNNGSSVLRFNGTSGQFISVFLSGGLLNGPYAIAFI